MNDDSPEGDAPRELLNEPAAEDAKVYGSVPDDPANPIAANADQDKAASHLVTTVLADDTSGKEGDKTNQVKDSEGGEQGPPHDSVARTGLRPLGYLLRWIDNPGIRTLAQAASTFATLYIAWMAVGFAKDQARQAKEAVGAAMLQVAEAKKQVATANEQTKVMVAGNSDAKNNLEASLKLSRDQMVLAQRAWVGVSKVDVDSANRVFLLITNSGQSTARHVAVTFESRYVLAGSGRPRLGANRISEGLLVPGAQFPLSVQEKLDIIPGKDLYVYGRIEYSDVFHQRHWTNFCLIQAPALHGYRWCTDYNSADQEGEAPDLTPNHGAALENRGAKIKLTHHLACDPLAY